MTFQKPVISDFKTFTAETLPLFHNSQTYSYEELAQICRRLGPPNKVITLGNAHTCTFRGWPETFHGQVLSWETCAFNKNWGKVGLGNVFLQKNWSKGGVFLGKWFKNKKILEGNWFKTIWVLFLGTLCSMLVFRGVCFSMTGFAMNVPCMWSWCFQASYPWYSGCTCFFQIREYQAFSLTRKHHILRPNHPLSIKFLLELFAGLWCSILFSLERSPKTFESPNKQREFWYFNNPNTQHGAGQMLPAKTG